MWCLAMSSCCTRCTGPIVESPLPGHFKLSRRQGCIGYGSYGAAWRELFFLKLGFTDLELRAETVERKLVSVLFSGTLRVEDFEGGSEKRNEIADSELGAGDFKRGIHTWNFCVCGLN